MSKTDKARIQALAEDIDAHPEPLHADYTAEVRALVEFGAASLEVVLPLLMAEKELTRLRAQRVLEGVTRSVVQTPPRSRGQRDWEALWRLNGNYDWRAPEAERAASVRRWQDWLASGLAPAGSAHEGPARDQFT